MPVRLQPAFKHAGMRARPIVVTVFLMSTMVKSVLRLYVMTDEIGVNAGMLSRNIKSVYT